MILLEAIFNVIIQINFSSLMPFKQGSMIHEAILSMHPIISKDKCEQNWITPFCKN